MFLASVPLESLSESLFQRLFGKCGSWVINHRLKMWLISLRLLWVREAEIGKDI